MKFPIDEGFISRLNHAVISQAEALDLLASINYGPMPGLTDEQVRTFFSIAYPGEELEIDHIHHEGWFDDDSVSDEEKATYLKQIR